MSGQSMRERLARTLAAHEGHDLWELLLKDADVVLAALYDPTEAMIAAITPQRSTDGRENYQHMIAAAMEGA